MASSSSYPSSSEALLGLLDELRNAERRAAVSRVASIIGHMIGTPLQVISGRTWLLRSSPTPEATLENARRIEEQVDRLAQRVQSLTQYLTAPDVEHEDARPVAELLSQALALYLPIAESSGTRIELSGAQLSAKLPATSVLILLTSLLSLAIRIAPSGSTLVLETTTNAEQRVVLSLYVPGLQVPKTRIDRLEPPEAEEQVGADALQVLTVCHSIARRVNGKLSVLPVKEGLSSIHFECPVSA